MNVAFSPNAVRRLSLLMALAGVLVALSGCALPSLRGSAFADEPKIGRKSSDAAMAPNQGASVYGFSTKARQIEQNLGVQ